MLFSCADQEKYLFSTMSVKLCSFVQDCEKKTRTLSSEWDKLIKNAQCMTDEMSKIVQNSHRIYIKSKSIL